MSDLDQLALRRGRLVERAQHERALIARTLAPLAGADRLLSRAWPLAAAAGGLLLVARPRGALRWLRYAVAARQAWKFFSKKG